MQSQFSLTKTNYYRIKQVAKDGKSVYSPVRYVKFDMDVLSLTPNPATNYVNISSVIENVQISIYNGEGRKVITQKLNGKSIRIPVASLTKGTYTVTAENKGVQVDSKKIIIQ